LIATKINWNKTKKNHPHLQEDTWPEGKRSSPFIIEYNVIDIDAGKFNFTPLTL
jgi:hypothetical protein